MIKSIISLLLIVTLASSGCSSLGYDSSGNPITSLNVSNNFTGPQGATGATGATGSFANNQSSVNMTNPYLYGNVTMFSPGILLYKDVYGTIRRLFDMGNVPTGYGYQSSIYVGIDNGNTTSNASFQGAFGIGNLAKTDNLSEGNWAFGDVVFGNSTNLTYSNGFGDGVANNAHNSSRLTLVGDHIIYNTNNQNFTGHDLEIIGGRAGGNLTTGWYSQVIGQGAAGHINDLRNSVIIGYNAASSVTTSIANAIIIGPQAGSTLTSLNNTLWIGDGLNNSLPLILGNMASGSSALTIYSNNGLVARNSADNAYTTLKGKINFVDSLGTTGNAPFFTASVNDSWIKMQAYANGGALTTVATLESAVTPKFVLNTAPKFAINSVSGPSNNVTPVTWIPVLLADNSTAYIPAYK